MNRTLIIAEAGVNHNGDINLAKDLISLAAESGADYVKFQSFKADRLVSRKARKAEYQLVNTKDPDTSQFTMLKKLELTERDHFELVEKCRKEGIRFLSSAFDETGIEFLEKLKLDYWKIPSGEITNLPYLKKIGGYGGNVILSTGMASMKEIEVALNHITGAGTPQENVIVLHCNTQYPTPYRDVNLLAMLSIRDELGVRIGYSDHSPGIEVPIAAVALGAEVIEKHFTLDKALPGPDHKASLSPAELRNMIKSVRNIELALGTGVKEVTESEMLNREIVRKSVHTAGKMKKGQRIRPDDMILLRPGDGIPADCMDELLGKEIVRDLPEHHKIEWTDLSETK
jgi:N,N'-diacetyllegionaminate synthase